MGTVFVKDRDAGCVLGVRNRLRAEKPAIQVRTFTEPAEYRYAITVERPDLVILGRGESLDETEALIWETKAMCPSSAIVVLADDHESTERWSKFGDAIQQVVTLANVCDACAGMSTDTGQRELREHRLKNCLAGLLAGLHAMAAELRAQPEQARQIGDDYIDRLLEVVHDIDEIADTNEREAEDPVWQMPSTKQQAQRL